MKKNLLRLSMIACMTVFMFVRCGSSSMLGAASPLMSALGGAPNLSGITKVLQTPGLGDLLGGVTKKPFTLLAPTNDALAKVPSGVLSNLTKPENINQLAGLLKDHIVPGKLDAGGLMGKGLKSAGGKDLNLGGVNLGNLIGGKKFNILPVDKVLN